MSFSPFRAGPCPCRRRACRSSSDRRASFFLQAAKNESRMIFIPRRAVLSRRLCSWLSMSLSALVLLGALAREDVGVDHDAADTRRNAQRGVANVAGLFAEDRAQELLFGRSWVSPFGVILPTRMSPGFTSAPMRTMPLVVEVLEGLFADVRDVARDLFLAELGVAGDALELLDVDRGEDVVLRRGAREMRIESSKL